MIRRGRARSASIPLGILNDENLSFRAAGVAAFLLSKPEGWRINSESLARSHAEGRDAIRSSLRELELGGYLVRRRYQDPTTGRWWTESVLYESAEAAADEADDTPPQPGDQPGENPTSDDGIPGVGYPAVGSPGPIPSVSREITPNPSKAGAPRSRSLGTNPRAQGTNPRAQRPDPLDRTARAARALEAKGRGQILQILAEPDPTVDVDQVLAGARAHLGALRSARLEVGDGSELATPNELDFEGEAEP